MNSLPMRKQRYDTIINIRLPSQLKKEAESSGINISELCRQAITSALKQLKGKK